MLVQALAALLPLWPPANVPRKGGSDSPSTYFPATYGGPQDGIPGSQFHPDLDLVIVAIFGGTKTVDKISPPQDRNANNACRCI